MQTWWSHLRTERVSSGVKTVTHSMAVIAVTVLLAACDMANPSPSASPPPPTGLAATIGVSSPPASASASAPAAASAPAVASAPVPAPSATAPSPTTPPAGSRAAAPMILPRVEGHATLLADGTVLVLGEDACLIAGANPGSERAEIYDPTADRWARVGSLNKPRSALSLVARPDGTAMVLGGLNRADEGFSSTKVYEPSNRAWVDGPLMARAGVVGAVVLSDGRIVAAGWGDAEILDDGATQWRRSTAPPRSDFILELVPLATDLVGAIGERDDEARTSTILVFDPERARWDDIGDPGVFRPSAIGLNDGSILVFGDDEGGSHVRRYSAVTEKWSDAAQLADGRTRQQMTLLPDGRVLVAGGVELISRPVDGGNSVTEGTVLKSTEIYDPDTDTWAPGPPLLGRRQGGLAIPLPDGSVFILGGYRKTPRDDGPPTTGSPGPCPTPLGTTERLVVGN